MAYWIIGFVFLAGMLAAAVWDLFTMTIPNRICLALVAEFFGAAALVQMPLPVLAQHVVCGMAILTIGFVLFQTGSLGGGDAKLLAAAALWLGSSHLLQFLAYVGLAGGVLALVLLKFRAFPLPARFASEAWLARLHTRSEGIPYGIAIAAGAILLFPATHWYGAQF